MQEEIQEICKGCGVAIPEDLSHIDRIRKFYSITCYRTSLRTERIQVKCIFCGKIIELTQRDLDRKLKNSKYGIFCSISCGIKWRYANGKQENPMNFEEFREKARLGVIESRADPEFRKMMSDRK